MKFILVAILGLSVSFATAAPARKPAKPSKPAAPKPPVVVVPVLTPREQLYKELGVTSLFVQDGQLLPRAGQLRDLIQSAGEHGLDPAQYWT